MHVQLILFSTPYFRTYFTSAIEMVSLPYNIEFTKLSNDISNKHKKIKAWSSLQSLISIFLRSIMILLNSSKWPNRGIHFFECTIFVSNTNSWWVNFSNSSSPLSSKDLRSSLLQPFHAKLYLKEITKEHYIVSLHFPLSM